jgi:hypothetical protein
MVKDGIRTGEATSVSDTQGDGKGVYKFENTAQVFLNDDFGNGSSWHGELKLTRDSKAINGYDGHMNMSQQDYLRELYVDTKAGDWDLRIGKQQVVWGTADGIKLLDKINPTDWREFNQNTMAESRIPVWMVNAEKYLDGGANVQFVFSTPEKNVIAGLNATGDQGHPFIMKGVDSITGKVNGFLNVAPALGQVANTFAGAAYMGGFEITPTLNNNALSAATYSTSLVGFTNMTVDSFAGNLVNGNGGYAYDPSSGKMYAYGQTSYVAASAADGSTLLNNFAQATNNNVTALAESTWGISTPDVAFEYMPMATFATFNTMAGVTTKYVVDKDDNKPNLGFRFRNSTANGLNYSFNVMHAADANPYIDLGWFDRSSGEALQTVYVQGGQSITGLPVSGSTITGTEVTADTVNSTYTLLGSDSTALAAAVSAFDTAMGGAVSSAQWTPYLAGSVTNATTVLLKNAAGEYYGARNWSTVSGANANNDVELRFTEKTNRSTSIGGSLDYAIDTETNPIVLRGEWLYTRNEMTPVVDKRLLAIGDLAGALTMQEADMFRYVIGADTTIMTDMMLSGQFIQFRNLDYVDEKRTCTTATGTSIDCSKYTADMPTLHMSNQLQSAEENKEFYSLFLSKPFGESGEGRWNNIFIYEEGGGKWNRFDVEYGINDQLIGTFEYNKYFGDKNTMFGQFENASNVQVGIKYLLQ